VNVGDEDDLDAPYRRAMKHARDFMGLDIEQARALAAILDLSLDIVEADGWHTGVNVTGRVTVFIRDGIIVGTG
jgi:hypothetical protein